MAAGLYIDILNKAPEAAAQDATVQALGNGTVDQVAKDMLMSEEGLSNLVDDAFRSILRRAPSADEQQWWVSRLKTQTYTVGEMMTLLLGSPDFQHLASHSVR